jgi:hypothetical protein
VKENINVSADQAVPVVKNVNVVQPANVQDMKNFMVAHAYMKNIKKQ